MVSVKFAFADKKRRLIHVADPTFDGVMAIADYRMHDYFSLKSTFRSGPSPNSRDDEKSLLLQTHAAYILGKVWSFIKRESSCAKSCRETTFWKLDEEVRSLSMIAIQNSADHKDTLCIASPVIFM
jgi:hypothetical protein